MNISFATDYTSVQLFEPINYTSFSVSPIGDIQHLLSLAHISASFISSVPVDEDEMDFQLPTNLFDFMSDGVITMDVDDQMSQLGKRDRMDSDDWSETKRQRL
jgi:hypothetical protein